MMTHATLKLDADRRAMDDALSALWEKSREGVLERVTVIESATRALRDGPLSDEVRAGAERAAHKLAGVAGTFGYWDATELARDAETAFEGRTVISPDVVQRLGEIAEELRRQLSAGPER